MIKKITLKNFKIYQDSEIHFKEMMSILTGENNSGKTSLLEAFLIFQECYKHTLHKIVRKTSSKVKNKILSVGDYDFQSQFITQFNSVRSENYYELFYQNTDSFEIGLNINIDDKTIDIKFSISKARSESAYNITPYIDNNSLQTLNEFDSENFIFFVKSSPISAIVRNEPYYPPKMLEKYISENSNVSIMRNSLLKIKNENKLLNLQSQISYILGFENFQLNVLYDINKDLYITAQFKTENMNEYQDIAMLGSGTLQIIEILISLNFEDKYSLRVALLDEPDSHLHRKLQSSLLSKLREISKNNIQIILTTHNEQIISNANLQEILHLYIPKKSNKLNVKPLSIDYQSGRTIGFLNNLNKQAIYSSLGISTTVMNMLEAIESNKVVLVEGSSDAIYIEALQQRRTKLFPTKYQNKVAFWSINGIDDLPNKLKYWKSILENISNENNVWSKSILVLDMDCLSKDEAEELANQIKSEYNINVLFWNSYTIESIIFEDINGFCNTFALIFDLDKTEVSREVNSLLSKINIEEFKNKISGQRTSREKTYEVFNSRKLKLNDGQKYYTYIKYLENSQNKANYLFGKDEVFEIFNILFHKFQIVEHIENQDLVVEIMQHYDSQYWQSQWTDILKQIYG
jgi:AAA15 family ATPase/GTPase